jgi:hypothetical protein
MRRTAAVAACTPPECALVEGAYRFVFGAVSDPLVVAVSSVRRPTLAATDFALDEALI